MARVVGILVNQNKVKLKKDLNISKCHISTINERMKAKFQAPNHLGDPSSYQNFLSIRQP
jgi:hypothetical protein